MCVSGWFKKKGPDEKKEISSKCCGEKDLKDKQQSETVKEKVSAS